MGRKTSRSMALWMILIILLVSLTSQNVAAQGDAALMGDISVSAKPESQGAGGPITITVSVPFYGGCCYPLWAYDVQATLNVPEQVTIIEGPIPSNYAEIEAKAGGEADYYNFKWTVKSMTPAEYTVSATVTSENCGSAEGSVGFTVTEGCVMTIPEVYPKLAPTNRDINLNLEALSPMEGVSIENVTLFFVTSDTELDIEKTKNDVINYKDGSSDTGRHIPMYPNEKEEYKWETVIPGQTSTTYLYYWIVAVDSDGNTTTSPAYKLKIEDLEGANLVVNLAFWLPILFTIGGMLIIFGYIGFSKRRAFKRNKDGPYIIGTEEATTYDLNSEQYVQWRKKIRITRGVLFIILLIITVIFLAWAIITNVYDELIYIVEGGL